VPVVYAYACLRRQIVVYGEFVREATFPVYHDRASGVVEFVTLKGRKVAVPWSAIEFALPIEPEPEPTKPEPAKVFKQEQPPEHKALAGRPRKIVS
jgi:hypothetical protein